MNQLFLISDEAWAASDPQEIDRICEDLKELNLYHLPYPVIDIGVSVDAAVTFVDSSGKPTTTTHPRYNDRIVNGKSVPPLGPSILLVYRGVCLSGDSCHAEMIGPFPGIVPTGTGPQPEVRLSLINLLIALLATRNTRREVKHNKLARLGVGKKKSGLKRYSYITTLHPPEEKDLTDEAGNPVPTGKKRIPHLRRGHIRRKQHYGPQNQFIRSVFIPPTFINGSEEVLATRQAYNFSLAHHEAPAEKETPSCLSSVTSQTNLTSSTSSSD